MQKPASNDHPIHELLQQRWSPRAFDPRPVEPDAIRSLLEAARWAPSAFNEQPWSLVVARREEAEAYRAVADCLVEGNAWALRAPLLILTVARRRYSYNGKPNRHAWHDVGLATMSLVLQAEALGLRAHQMAGFDPDQARANLGIPEDQEPVVVMAVGYPGKAMSLPERVRALEGKLRTRNALDQFVFAGRFGSPWAGLADAPQGP